MKGTIRKINQEEYERLRAHFIGQGMDSEEATDTVESYWFGVIEDYISDGPGYAGKLIFAIYGEPQFYELLAPDEDGVLHRVLQEESFHEQ